MSNTNQGYDKYIPLVYNYLCMYILNELIESNYIAAR